MPAVTIPSDFGTKKIKSVTASTFSLSICHEMMEPDAMILVIMFKSFDILFFLKLDQISV